MCEEEAKSQGHSLDPERFPNVSQASVPEAKTFHLRFICTQDIFPCQKKEDLFFPLSSRSTHGEFNCSSLIQEGFIGLKGFLSFFY